MVSERGVNPSESGRDVMTADHPAAHRFCDAESRQLGTKLTDIPDHANTQSSNPLPPLVGGPDTPVDITFGGSRGNLRA